MNERSEDKSALLAGCDLVNLATYQDRSIVSQVLLKKRAGTVTLFAFDQGQGLSEHQAPFDALVYLLDGSADIVVGGNPHHLTVGELLLLPANVTHEVKAPERFKMLLIMIRSE